VECHSSNVERPHSNDQGQAGRPHTATARTAWPRAGRLVGGGAFRPRHGPRFLGHRRRRAWAATRL